MNYYMHIEIYNVLHFWIWKRKESNVGEANEWLALVTVCKRRAGKAFSDERKCLEKEKAFSGWSWLELDDKAT